MPSRAARAVAKTKRAMMSFSGKGAAPCKSYGEMRERASVPAARRLRSKAFFPHAASALTSPRVDLSKYQRPHRFGRNVTWDAFRIGGCCPNRADQFSVGASRSARIVVTLLHESPGPTTAGASLFRRAGDRFDRCYDPCQSRDRSSDVGVRAAARHESKRHRDAAPPRILRIVDVDQNGWASKIDRAWGAFGGIAALEGQNRCAKLRLAIAVLFAASAALTADAQTSRGANNVATAAQNFTPIEPAACRGWGLIAGLDSRASAAASVAGVAPAGKRSKNGAAAAGGPTICGFSATR
jgi:hypothetical protein